MERIAITKKQAKEINQGKAVKIKRKGGVITLCLKGILRNDPIAKIEVQIARLEAKKRKLAVEKGWKTKKTQKTGDGLASAQVNAFSQPPV